MSLIKKILSLFAEEDSVTELTFEELPGFASEFIEKRLAEFKDKNLVFTFQKKMEELNDNIYLLEKADLPDQPVDEKTKVMVISNRDAYVTQLKLFLKDLDTDLLSLENFQKFYTKFNYLINELNNKTARNFHISQTLLKETTGVAESLKELDNLLKKLKEAYEKEKLHEVYELKDNINLYLKTTEDKKIAKKQKGAMQKKIEELDEEKLGSTKKIDEIKTSEKFREVMELKKRKNEVSMNIQNLKQKVLELFSPIEKSIKKYAKLNPSTVIMMYAEKPFEALIYDKNLSIAEHLKKIRNEILTLDMDEQKMAKTLNTIELLGLETLKDLQNEYLKLESEHKIIRNKINYDHQEEKINIFLNEIDHIDYQQKQLRKKLAELDSKFEIDENELKENIINSFRLFNKQVVFKESQTEQGIDAIQETVVEDGSNKIL